MKRSHKATKILIFTVKLAIVICACWYLYAQIFKTGNFSSLSTDFKVSLQSSKSILLFCIAFTLMPINWVIESKKWQLLIGKIENVKLTTSFQAVLAGLTISAFTPNRTGEFVGRIAYINKADRIKGALITILGSLSQLTVTMSLGALSLIILLAFDNLSIQYILKYSGIFVLSAILVICPFFYFNAYLMYAISKRLSFNKKLIRYLRIFDLYSIKELGRVLMLSAIRYVVFTTQFVLMLYVFGVNLSVIEAIITATSSFFLIATIPSTVLYELGIREASAVFFASLFCNDTTGVVAASFFLWFINIAIPAMGGTIFVFKARFIKTVNHE